MAGRAPLKRTRNHIPLDVDYCSQDTVRELGDALGPGGPLAFINIVSEAHKQAHAGGDKPQGVVDMRYGALAVASWITVNEATAVVDLCVEAGLMELLEGSTPRRFVARLLKWEKWEAKDITAADRQRRSRAKEKQTVDSVLADLFPED